MTGDRQQTHLASAARIGAPYGAPVPNYRGYSARVCGGL